MEILYSASDINSAIRKVLRAHPSGGRRVALVAYVGASAEAFLSNVKGLEIVCSLEPGATSATALRRLRRRGARLYYSPGLHMKVYWSQRGGAVVCSANLSGRALGRGGLKEAGVLLGPDELDIRKLWRYAAPRKITPEDLRQLAAQSDALAASGFRAPAPAAKSRQPDYLEWYSGAGRKPWKLGWWTEDGDLARASIEQSRATFGVSEPADFLGAAKGRVAPGDWLLCFRLPAGTGPQWLYVDFVSPISPSDDNAYEPEYPYQAVQVHPASRYPDPPFRITDGLRRALRAAVGRHGSDPLQRIRSLVPPRSFLALIAKYSRAGAP